MNFWRNSIVSMCACLASLVAFAESWHDQKIISDGSKLTVGEDAVSGLSIVPPVDWEVYTQHPSLTLLMQAQKDPKLRYQRTIQVASFQGPRFSDEITAEEYEKLITKKFSELSAAVEEYRIRDHHFIEVGDGRPAILFYSEFTMDSVAMMQAHILVSDQAKHYLVTFTDTADHFEEEKFANYLTEAWDAMISLELKSPAPGRYDALMKLSFYAVGLVMALLLIWFVRYASAVKKYRRMENEDFDDLSDSSTVEAGEDSVSLEAVALEANVVEDSEDKAEGVSSQSLFTTRHPRPLFKRIFPIWKSKNQDIFDDEDELLSSPETKLDKVAESYETQDDVDKDEDLVV